MRSPPRTWRRSTSRMKPCGTQMRTQQVRSRALSSTTMELLAISLRQTARDHEPAARARLLVLGQLQNRVDRFLLRLVDERAGVDDEDICVRGVGRELVAGLLGQPEHHL